MSDESELINKHVVFDKDLRNKCRRIFLKELKKDIILKSKPKLKIFLYQFSTEKIIQVGKLD